jgi:GTPase SAR1 family protein
MDLEADDTDIVRISLLGPSQTGKSTFASSVVSRSLSRTGTYQRTTRNLIRYVQLRPRNSVGLHLEDTPGTAKVSGDTFEIGRNHVFIVFFDWSRPDTKRIALEIIGEIREAEIRLKKRPLRPIFLVGNKTDLVPNDHDKEIDRLRKLAHSSQQFYLFSGSVMRNSFTLLEKPRKADKNYNFFCKIHDMSGVNDFEVDYTAMQLVANIQVLFDELCNGGTRRFAGSDKDESHPLLESVSLKSNISDSSQQGGWCARVCRCCSRRKT